jgi:tetratricopeptide (TPR) repeat protein
MSTDADIRPIADVLDLGPEALFEAVRAHLAPGFSHEDPPVPTEVVDHVQRVFAEAASGAADQAAAQRAFLGWAMADTLRPALPAFRRAEQSVRRLLDQPAGTVEVALELDARLLLLDILGRVIDAEPADGRPAFLRRALDHARSVEYLATREGTSHGRARALASEATWQAECFDGDRDQLLMDAVETGTRALALVPPDVQAREVRWPLLHLELGNACVKIAPDRERWLRRGLAHYARGRALVDVARHPGLARVLEGNAAVQGSLGDEDKRSLPPKEMSPRYRRRVELAAAAGEREAALAAANEAVAWAQGLVDQPNQFVGHAHVLLGQLLHSLQRWDEATAQFEHAVVVLEQVFAPAEREYGYVRGARSFLEQARARAPLGGAAT